MEIVYQTGPSVLILFPEQLRNSFYSNKEAFAMALSVESGKTELLVKSLNLIIQRINHYSIRGQMLVDFVGMP